jgi:hypothetical protein
VNASQVCKASKEERGANGTFWCGPVSLRTGKITGNFLKSVSATFHRNFEIYYHKVANLSRFFILRAMAAMVQSCWRRGQDRLECLCGATCPLLAKMVEPKDKAAFERVDPTT